MDNVSPVAAGNLTLDSITTTTIVHTLGAAGTDTNLNEYKIYYVAGASGVATSDTLDATIATADLADSSVTSAKIADGAVTQAIEDFTTSLSTTESGVTYDDVAEIAMTTTGGKVFCVFSAYATTTAINQDINLIMSVDEELVARTLRKVTTSDGNGFNSISNNVILDLAAGAHIIKVIWNTSVGATANMTFPVLDCIELKK